MKNIFIVNKASKTGRAAEYWKKVEEYLEHNNIEYETFYTSGQGDATRFAIDATKDGEDVALFVFGGDGTLNEALNGIRDFTHTYYTPLPSGSANDFVNGIGLEGSALDILERALFSDDHKLLDIGRVEYEIDGQNFSRLFGVSSGIGVDAYVCLQALDSKLKRFLNHFGMGAATYGLLTVGDLFTMPFSNATVYYSYNGNEIVKKMKGTIFCAAMNCPAEGGGIPMAPDARADTGYLTAFYAHDISRIKCFTLLPSLIAGKHGGKKGFDFLKFDKMEIQMDKAMCVHADGEHVGFLNHIVFKCMPSILRVRGF